MQKEWTQQYLRECVSDEQLLALLHPAWRRRFTTPSVLTQTADLCQPARRTGGLVSAGASRLTFSASTTAAPPRWRRDWQAAGDLSVELGLTVRHDQEDGTVSAGTGGGRRNVTERYEDHPTRTAATWAAIVRAAIELLEARSAL